MDPLGFPAFMLRCLGGLLMVAALVTALLSLPWVIATALLLLAWEWVDDRTV